MERVVMYLLLMFIFASTLQGCESDQNFTNDAVADVTDNTNDSDDAVTDVTDNTNDSDDEEENPESEEDTYDLSLGIDETSFTHHSGLDVTDPPTATMENEVSVTFVTSNNSPSINATDIQLVITASSGDIPQSEYWLELYHTDCTTVASIEIHCQLGSIEASSDASHFQKPIVHINSNMPGTVDLMATVSTSIHEIDVENNSYLMNIEYTNGENDLRTVIEMKASLIDDPREDDFKIYSQGDLGNVTAYHPVSTITVPEEIQVNSASIYEYEFIFDFDTLKVIGENEIYLGECEDIVPPDIVCSIPIPISQYGNNIIVRLNHTGLIEGEVEIISSIDSEQAHVDDASEPWQSSATILVAKSLTAYQSVINEATEPTTIVLADGVFAGALNFQDKEIVLTSENGKDFTSLLLLDYGIHSENEGEVSGFSFLNTNSSIASLYGNMIIHHNDFTHDFGTVLAVGGNLEFSNNVVSNFDSVFMKAYYTDVSVSNNIFKDKVYGAFNGAFSCGVNSPVLEFMDNREFRVINNMFINVNRSLTYCHILNYYQGGNEDSVLLDLGLISHNLFYSDGYVGQRLLYADVSPDIDALYVQNNIFYSTSVIVKPDGWNFIALHIPHITNNLFFGTLSSSGYYGENWILDQDPLFIDLENRDFSLTSSSPAIDAGIGSYPLEIDFSGNLRPIDGNGDGVDAYDIGPYEFDP